MSASGFTYDVVGESPDVAKPDLCRLWQANLHLEQSAAAHFAWLYHEAPDPSSTVFLLRAHSADGGVHIVGTNSVSIRRYQLAPGVEGRAAVSGDLTVEPAHRSLLPALKLARSVRELAARDFDLGYGFPNAKAKGVMIRAGFKQLGLSTRYVRVLRHARYLRDVARRLDAPKWIARLTPDSRRNRLLAPFVDLSRLVATVPSYVRARSRRRLEWFPSFDARVDDLWTRARGEYEVVGARTHEFLRWRYPACEVAALFAARTLVAYAVIEQEQDTGAAHIRDLFGHKAELGTLIDLILPALYRRGAASASVQFLGAPYVLDELLRRGFEPRPDPRTIVVQVGASREDRRARLESADAWHLFDVDEDT